MGFSTHQHMVFNQILYILNSTHFADLFFHEPTPNTLDLNTFWFWTDVVLKCLVFINQTNTSFDLKCFLLPICKKFLDSLRWLQTYCLYRLTSLNFFFRLIVTKYKSLRWWQTYCFSYKNFASNLQKITLVCFAELLLQAYCFTG